MKPIYCSYCMKELTTRLKAIPSLGRIIHTIEPHKCGEKKELPDEIKRILDMSGPKSKFDASKIEQSVVSRPKSFPHSNNKPSNAEFESMKGPKPSNIKSTIPDGILNIIKKK